MYVRNHCFSCFMASWFSCPCCCWNSCCWFCCCNIMLKRSLCLFASLAIWVCFHSSTLACRAISSSALSFRYAIISDPFDLLLICFAGLIFPSSSSLFLVWLGASMHCAKMHIFANEFARVWIGTRGVYDDRELKNHDEVHDDDVC